MCTFYRLTEKDENTTFTPPTTEPNKRRHNIQALVCHKQKRGRHRSPLIVALSAVGNQPLSEFQLRTSVCDWSTAPLYS